MTKDTKKLLTLSGTIIGSILVGVGLIKVAKFAYDQTNLKKKNDLTKRKKELDASIEEAETMETVIKENLSKVAEIMQNNFDNMNKHYKPGFNYEWYQQRTTDLTAAQNVNRQQICLIELQRQLTEFELCDYK